MNSKKIDIRDKIGILIALALLILVILGVSSFSYLKIKKRIISDIDRSLLVGAASIKNLLPEDFHDKATSLKSFAPEDDRQNIMALSEYANRINFKFLYTLIENDNKIYITSSSATEEELAQNEQVRYFTLFEEADPYFHSAFDGNTSISFTHQDRWGTFRALALPEKSPEGKTYLSVAEFDISYLNRIFQSALIETIIIALLLLLGALPLYFMVSKRLRRIVNELQVVQIELKKSEERFSLAMEASKEGIWDWDLKTGTIYCSPALISMLGYNTTKVIQNVDEWQEIIHPEDKQKVYQANFDCVNNLTDSFETEYRMKTKDEGLKWVLARGKAVSRDASGRALRLVGTHQDITERKQAEEERQLLFQIIDNTDSIAVSKDPDLRYLNVNQAYLRLTGHKSLVDLVGKTDAELFQGLATDEQIREYMDNDRKALTLPAGECITIEERLAGDDGGERFFLTKKFPIYSTNSENLLCVSTLSTEITERKRAEEALMLQLRFEQAVAEASKSLLSAQAYENAVSDSLRSLLEVSRVSRVYVFENFDDPDDGLCMRQIFEVCGPDIPPEIDNPVLQHVVYSQGFERWREALASGISIRGHVTDFPDEEREVLEPQGILSILVLPLVVDGKWWGFIGFDETHRPREWQDSDVALLVTTAEMLGSCFTRQKVNDRLERIAKELTLAQRISKVGNWFLDPVVGVPHWSDEVFRIYERDPALGPIPLADYPKIYSPEQFEVFRSAISTAIDDGTPYNIELHLRLPSGSEKWINAICDPLPQKGPAGYCLLGTLQDITERKQAYEDLRESEKRFSTAFRHSPAPLVLSEIDTGQFIDVNDRWVEMLGFSREESIGKASKEVGIWDDPGERDRIVAILRDQNHFRDEPIRFRAKSGKTVIALWSAATIDLSGKQAMLSMITDITQVRWAEEERERLEAQLQQAQKMEAIGRLAGGVAHDFNNMLSIVIGHADMILEEVKPGQPFYNDLMEIRKAGARSADLTRQLLGFARKQTVAPRVINLNKTVESMLKMLQRLIGEDIDMTWIPGGNVWSVKIDPGQVDQFLANLCVNARDAIDGVGKVTIETGNTVFDEAYCREHAGFILGEYAMLAVSDNGCGMDTETLSHLFEPFFTTKEQGKGTGLGLATVYGIVKQNDGFINVYSEQGQGTTFKIYLPRHMAKASPVLEKGADKPTESGRETVLLVEDESAILKMTTMMLKRQGYTVMGASTPGEAIRLATEHAGEVHLLMTDVVMPEMNGRDLARNILSLNPGLKCLFMSGYTANVIAQHGVLDEGVNFIQKPFSKSDLAVKVREILDRK